MDAAEKKKASGDGAGSTLKSTLAKASVMRARGRTQSMNVEAICTGCRRRWTLRWASAACPGAASWKCTARNPRARPPLTLHVVAAAQKAGGDGGLYRCSRTCAGPGVCRQALGVDVDSAAGLPARYRASRPWRSPRRWRVPRRRGRGRGGLGGGAGAQRRRSRARWATAFVGLQARLMSQALRKLAGAIAKSNCAAIFYQPAAR